MANAKGGLVFKREAYHICNVVKIYKYDIFYILPLVYHSSYRVKICNKDISFRWNIRVLLSMKDKSPGYKMYHMNGLVLINHLYMAIR